MKKMNGRKLAAAAAVAVGFLLTAISARGHHCNSAIYLAEAQQGKREAVSGCCGGHEHGGNKASACDDAEDEKPERNPQTVCPVMGGEIDKSLYVEHESKRVYICCPGCEEQVRENPAKCIGKLEADGVTLDKAQGVCPVMGGDIDRDIHTEHEGHRVYFCCAGCVEKFENDPEKYMEKLEKLHAEEHSHCGHVHEHHHDHGHNH